MFNNKFNFLKDMWWPFKKRSNEFDELKKAIELSFSNVKKDFEAIKSDHHTKISDVMTRLDKLESGIIHTIDARKEIQNAKIDVFQSLTEKQKTFLRVLASLNAESPNNWISLKALSEELYPDKEYDKVRPMISLYLGHLEELGFAKKKRKGLYTYAITTEANPYVNELKQLKPEEPKKQDKKSKQS